MTHDEKELSRFSPVEKLNAKQDWHMMCLRTDFIRLAKIILRDVPASADRSAAMRYLRLAHMQVNAAICHDWPAEEVKENG